MLTVHAFADRVILPAIVLLVCIQGCSRNNIGSTNPVIIMLERRLQDKDRPVQSPDYVFMYHTPVTSPALAEDAFRVYIETYRTEIGPNPHWSDVLESSHFYYTEGFHGSTVAAIEKGKSELTIWRDWEPAKRSRR